MTQHPHSPSRRGRGFLERFGATILRGGIAPIPTTLYFYQAELGLSPQEIWFTGYILAHKWDEDLPYPSLAKMETRTGMSKRNLLRIKDGLVGKGLLVLVPRFNADGGQESNAYDFTPLFERLEEFIRRDGPRGDRQDVVEQAGEGRVTAASPPLSSEGDGVTMASPPGVTSESRPRVTSPSPNKEADHEETDHQEASPHVFRRHIPEGGSTCANGCGSDLSQSFVCPSSSLFGEESLKGYVYTSSSGDIIHEVKQSSHKEEGTADPASNTSSDVHQLWQAAQVRLRLSLPAEDFNKVVRYASLLTYDPVAGIAVVGLPNTYLCKQVTTRLVFPIATALGQVSGRPVQVRAAVHPAGKQLAGQQPPPAVIHQTSNSRRSRIGRSNS
jgi:hypothetical protein